MKRLVALIVPLLLSGGPAFAAAPSPHHETGRAGRVARERPVAQKLPIDVVLDRVGPKYLTEKATLRLSGQLVNRSDSPYQRVAVRLRYSTQQMIGRGELDVYASGKGADPPVAGTGAVVAPNLPVGAQQNWSLAMPVKRMGLRAFGVYPIEVEVYNASGVLGRQRTFVTYYPKGSDAKKTKISWVWPVVDQPHRADDATFVDDKLERQFGGGRLKTLVDAAAQTKTPLSWLVDPSLVDDAAHMAADDGYTIKGTVRRGRNVAADSWLNALRSAIGAEQLIATPYADPDVVALTRHGMTRDIASSFAAALPTLRGAGLGTATTSVVAPPDGLVDQQTLATLVGAGGRTFLLSSANLPTSVEDTYTQNPVAVRNVSGTPVKLIAYDDALQKVLDTNTNQPGVAVLAEQRFLAETLMITGERPKYARSVVVTPPRRWNPNGTFARTVLKDSAKVPWLHAVPLKDVEKTRPVSRMLQPQKDRTGLSGSYLRQVGELTGRIRRFESIFQPGADGRPTTSGFLLGVPRAESSAWAGQSRRGNALRQLLDARLTQSAAKIRVLNEGITLAGRSAQVPITISNELGHGTVLVRLHASSQNDTRLRVEGGDRTLTLDAGHKEQVTLNMKASANGPAYVDLELLAPDGRPFGKTGVLRVSATAYGRTALLITGISLVVLFLGIGIRVIRRKSDGGAEETGG